MTPDRPAGTVPLHTCHGKDRLWIPAEKCGEVRCRCGSPLAADMEYVPSHANFPCRACQRVIGICGSGLIEQVEEWALRVLNGAKP